MKIEFYTSSKYFSSLIVLSMISVMSFGQKNAKTTAPQTPYNNNIVSLPGKIEIENYDNGGQDISFHDATSTNEGGAFRTDAVDIQTCTDAGAGYNIGYVADGEWLEYTVNVTNTAKYNINFRSASTVGGTVQLEVDGTNTTGLVGLPNTGNWQTWSTTTASNISLTAGQHVFRIYIVSGGSNLNYVSVSVPTATTGPGFLHASGKNIINNNGNFVIKAINYGNFMVQEGYMLNLGGGYQHIIKQKIANVIGTSNMNTFYDDYYKNIISQRDIDSIAKWGFNSIRLPMHYALFTPLGQPTVFTEKNFVMVDSILAWCKKAHVYLILDLHAAPGGQSSGDISDYISGQSSLWESAANRDQTVKLWKHFAQRYVNEQWIGGYDLINETNWTLANSNALLAQLMKDITTAIRTVDNNHILFIEGNSYANDYNGLTPKWDNNMAYSFHKYWNDPNQASLNFVLNIRDGQNVPIWAGEFGENSNHWNAEAIKIFNQNNIGWAIWPYKKMGSVSGISSFKEPSNWSTMADYINGGTMPSAATAQTILNELANNVKVENCTVNYGYLFALFNAPYTNSPSPYRNTRAILPGKITAVKYDEGKNGFAYSDVVYQTAQFGSAGGNFTAWNTGWFYRNDGVDIQQSASENTPIVGYIETNEWMQYSVNVIGAASYTVKARVAGAGGNMSVSIDGTTLLNNIIIAATGGWDTWQTVTLGNINLTAGMHTVRVTFNTAGFNLNYLDFSTTTPVRAPYFGIPVNIPGKVEAENYDLGAQGIVYNDLTTANEVGAYRNDGVDIQICTDASMGYNTAYSLAGEWMEYAVNVTATGNYDVDFRIASNATGKKIHLEKNGVNISGTITVPNTTGWQTWQSVVVKNINLVQGVQTLRLVLETDGVNINYVNFTPTIVTSIADENIATEITLFPNPTSGILNIGEHVIEIDVTNISGKSQAIAFIPNVTQIDISSLSAGMYIIKLKREDSVQIERIIKK